MIAAPTGVSVVTSQSHTGLSADPPSAAAITAANATNQQQTIAPAIPPEPALDLGPQLLASDGPSIVAKQSEARNWPGTSLLVPYLPRAARYHAQLSRVCSRKISEAPFHKMRVTRSPTRGVFFAKVLAMLSGCVHPIQMSPPLPFTNVTPP